MIFESRFSWRHPYGWRTNLRVLLPFPLWHWIEKGEDCESRGSEHHWYNQDNESSACYYCEVVRPGQLWKKE